MYDNCRMKRFDRESIIFPRKYRQAILTQKAEENLGKKFKKMK